MMTLPFFGIQAEYPEADEPRPSWHPSTVEKHRLREEAPG